MYIFICPMNCKDCYAMHVCAVRAIASKDGAISIDTGKCIFCGSCSTACMTYGHKIIRPQKVRKQSNQQVAA
jgi:Fe-S-cluster-containing hydrogenase component 2